MLVFVKQKAPLVAGLVAQDYIEQYSATQSNTQQYLSSCYAQLKLSQTQKSPTGGWGVLRGDTTRFSTARYDATLEHHINMTIFFVKKAPPKVGRERHWTMRYNTTRYSTTRYGTWF
ncbi:MAG TPA: hypothetical protein VJZ94_02200 [Candidatus Paceibacterota bacterium]|nr:hypothetical protein [Candidatus Paceibacterota bacterium]